MWLFWSRQLDIPKSQSRCSPQDWNLVLFKHRHVILLATGFGGPLICATSMKFNSAWDGLDYPVVGIFHWNLIRLGWHMRILCVMHRHTRYIHLITPKYDETCVLDTTASHIPSISRLSGQDTYIPTKINRISFKNINNRSI